MPSDVQPVLVTLSDAKQILGGRHPATFGISPVCGSGRGQRYYVPLLLEKIDEVARGYRDSPAPEANDNGEHESEQLKRLKERFGGGS